jgi:hypothetical protein
MLDHHFMQRKQLLGKEGTFMSAPAKRSHQKSSISMLHINHASTTIFSHRQGIAIRLLSLLRNTTTEEKGASRVLVRTIGTKNLRCSVMLSITVDGRKFSLYGTRGLSKKYPTLFFSQKVIGCKRQNSAGRGSSS